MNKEFLRELNAAYSLLETKKAEIVHDYPDCDRAEGLIYAHPFIRS